MNQKKMKALVTIGWLFLIGILFLSCKREKKDHIGPELGIATRNFKMLTEFSINDPSINFSTDSNWFNAVFNEHVSWIIKVKGLQSKAEKTFKGTSENLGKNNTLWTGGHSGLYFFKPGEQIVSELTIFGTDQVWYDTSVVAVEKNNYGEDVLVWWDMNTIGVAKNGPGSYWFDFYDGDAATPAAGIGERLLDKIENSPRTDNDPIQNIYRSLEGKDGLGPTNYYVGGCGHGPLVAPIGFTGSPETIYLNVYLRRRTNTTGLGLGLVSVNASNVATEATYNVGEVTWEGWKLVSVPMSALQVKAGDPPFDPSRIVKFFANLQIVSGPGVDQTGFDIDFITITKGGPFNPDKY